MDNGMQVVDDIVTGEYKYGFISDIDQEIAPIGLNEEIVRMISAKKNEPLWMLEWRLKAYAHWLTLKEPKWSNVTYPTIDFNDISYYAEPKQKEVPKSLDEIDPELRKTFEKLGISLVEQERLSGIAVDAVLDSVSVATTFKEKLLSIGVIFCSMSDAIQEYPELVRKHLGSVVPIGDNYYTALNSAL